jgi:monofunctional biosynthetic peptidoglycan transglycosylase
MARPSRRVRRVAIAAFLAVIAIPIFPIVVFRFLHPLVTPFMLVRMLGGAPIRYQWVPLPAMSPQLVRAVVAAEDSRFMQHKGFDWIEVDAAWRDSQRGRRLRGASTISMQAARTLFLWPGRDVLRKGTEVYLTVFLESLWPKRRILEMYLNLVEWGDGIYGCEAAAQTYFSTSCAALNAQQAARLAAILPSPRLWSPTRPKPYVLRRSSIILARMRAVEIPQQ